ncbi:MAG: NAD(+) diphosphatase [Proteobacteria bacterium]|nr:NAD(+) diphosphatase [Pseudomonadota bacterium]
MRETQEIALVLKKYSDHLGIFFTDEGLLVNINPFTPFLSIAQTLSQLDLVMLSCHVNKDIVGIHCKVSAMNTLQYHKVMNIRACLAEVDLKAQSQILCAYQWFNWDNRSQFCGRCGAKFQAVFESTPKQCQQCQLILFPKMSPAVMVLIYREKEILLARSPHFNPGVYSAIAGFIDIGESAELAAHREVQEEIGIQITQLEYFTTQTWPFPDSFMIAYKAKYLQGEIQIDNNEIEDAKWFNKNNLPLLPNKMSISRKLIESVLLTL